MDQSNNGNRSNTTPAGGASPRKKKKSWIRRILGFFAKLFLVLFTLLVIGCLTALLFFNIFMTYVNSTLIPSLRHRLETGSFF